MPRPDEKLPEHYVQPGESQLVAKPSILRTVLGSCVGVTFWVPRLGVAALCHPMLPSLPADRKTNAAAGRRYVDFTIRDVARQLDSLGARRGEVQAKLFGGADVLPVAADSVRATVGRQNCEAAVKVLSDEGIGVVASSLGGKSGMNILFNTMTGEVLLRRLG